MPTASYAKFQPALELMLEGGNLDTVIITALAVAAGFTFLK